MTTDLEVSLPLAFYYDTKKPVPIPDVIKALSALERMSLGIPAFFSSISGAKVDSCALKVSRIESGSLKEYLELALKFLTTEERQKFEDWLKTTKMGKGLRYTIVGGVAAAAFVVVASSAITLVDKVSGTNAPSISASNSVVMVAGQNLFNATPKQLESAVNAALSKDRKKIASAALDFVKPASGQNGGAIYAGEDATSDLRISKEAARDAPDSVDFSASDQEISYRNVTIDIRTLNRDSDHSGWVARIQSIAKNKKLGLSFASGVDYSKATSQQFIQADITVTYTQDPNKGALVPKSVLVTRIY
ncbi:hypothetical protein [Pseudomonas aeruginosa]|uniref:hypothetical protein n=2 Tax=Pseudomonas aeruginosa TaxID=287 RepID=UPI002341BEE5|nr:hypothetical protein [Pseudomonas aeruginosa]MDC3857722.1 hypothetical protein [Pseudomonas aeruginosa]MDC3889090.1 hypothetical protein [Pseudomonas aeruginosa]MDC3918847.1 hypothetical protein [Pseudomonas aeruginosa]